MSIQRYKYRTWSYADMGGIEPDVAGKYVLHSDHAALLAQRDAEIARLSAALKDARRQAFEEAEQRVKELIPSDWDAAEPNARNEALDFAAYLINELAAKERAAAQEATRE